MVDLFHHKNIKSIAVIHSSFISCQRIFKFKYPPFNVILCEKCVRELLGLKLVKKFIIFNQISSLSVYEFVDVCINFMNSKFAEKPFLGIDPCGK